MMGSSKEKAKIEKMKAKAKIEKMKAKAKIEKKKAKTGTESTCKSFLYNPWVIKIAGSIVAGIILYLLLGK